MKIAIVGSGISGLACAHYLRKSHDITVFEANDYVGGHTHTIDVDTESPSRAVDTGFIVFNERTYPNLLRLFDELDIKKVPTAMSFSVSCAETGLEYGSRTLNNLFAQRRNLARPKFLRMIQEILRFSKESRELLQGEHSITLGDYLDTKGYSDTFQRFYALPMGAAIWSGSVTGIRDFPARHFVQFFLNHGLLDVQTPLQWYVVEGGSQRYVDRLMALFGDRVRTNAPVKSIERNDDQVIVTANAGPEAFDQVIVATHSDQALHLLKQPTALEAEILGALPYRSNEVVLHTDASLLPSNRRAWSSWNYLLSGNDSQPASVTYHMNRLQCFKDAPHEYCVTLNQTDAIDPEKIIGKYDYDHPIYSTASMAARSRVPEISGADRIWYCGAWEGWGFHEDGIRSAMNVVDQILGTDLRLAA